MIFSKARALARNELTIILRPSMIENKSIKLEFAVVTLF